MSKKILLKTMTFILCVVFLSGAFACGHVVDPADGPDSDKTVVRVMTFGGGVGRAWLDNAAQRFEELNAEKEYETGKKGVSINVSSNIQTNSQSMATSAEHIYFDQLSNKPDSMIQSGLFLDITDIVQEISDDTRDGQKVSIEQKLSKDAIHKYKGADGKYYALPHYEFYDGLTFDKDLFDSNGLYLAASESEGNKYDCKLVGKNFYFVKNENSKKSCGNDGVYGTQDDGLPTTLIEFVALCDYMKQEKSITPFTVAGGHIDYVNYFTIGLWASLGGYDQTKAAFTFNSQGVDTVTGFTSENLFAGVNNIKKPTSERKSVSEENGYLAYNSLSKYYALAFGQLMQEQGWISKRSTQNTHLHTDAMRDFMLNGIGKNEKIGMIMEGSYWLNEAEDNGIFEEYKNLTGSTTDKNLAWMGLPTSFDTPVTERNGREMTLINGVTTYAFVNGNLSTKPGSEGVIAAVKDFLKFLYSDAELKHFISQTGTTKADISIEIEEDILNNLTSGQQSLMKYRANNRVVQQDAENKTFDVNFYNLTYGIEKGFKAHFNGIDYACIVTGVRAGYSAQAYFDAIKITETKWLANYYKGA